MDANRHTFFNETLDPIVFNHINTEMQACIQICTRCAQICEQTIQHRLNMGGALADPLHIRRLQDCVEICQVAANFMLRDSDFHVSTCRACAEVCLMCAADCETLGDETMRVCAEACLQCGESCQKMTSHA